MTDHVVHPRRILMTLDAVGGVWRYAMDLAAALGGQGVQTVFAGFGPEPSEAQRAEAEAIGVLEWQVAPLDWLASGPDELAEVPRLIEDLVRHHDADLVHLNLPSQAAGLEVSVPVVVVSHSCVVTWFQAVRGHDVPGEWAWQKRLNAEGLARADAVVVPSRAHGEQVQAAYGPLDRLQAVANATTVEEVQPEKQLFAFSAGRWWDEGKNGRVLDEASVLTDHAVVMAGAAHGPNGEHLHLRHADDRGALPHAQVLALMRSAAIFVSPSRYEPFGLAPLEAARSDCALILSDIPTYRELWEDCAVFVDPGDAQGFADAIDKLCEDDGLRKRLAAMARLRARAFTTDAQCEAMLGVYSRALSQHQSPLDAPVAAAE